MRRTGEYQLQPKGYRAFIPAPPNPDPPVEIDIELQSLTRSMMREIDPVAKDLKSMKRIQHRYRASNVFQGRQWGQSNTKVVGQPIQVACQQSTEEVKY